MNKKKFLLGAVLLGTVASACAVAAGCSTKIKPAEKEYKPTLGYQLPYRETDPGVKIDGDINDEIYKNQNRLRCKKVAGAETADIEMVSYFGEKGIYIGTVVTENTGIYYNPVKATTDNSCVELYLSMGGTTNIDTLRKCFEIDMCCNGNINLKQKLISGKWISILGLDDARITYAAKTIGGEYNTPECTGYSCELFLPFEFLIDCGAMEEGETIEEIYCNPALITSYGYETSAKRNWFDVAGYNLSGYSWGNPSTAYHFDKDGLVYNDLKIEAGAGGTVTESHGYDYIISGSTVELDINVDAGYTLDSLIVNGIDRKDSLTVENDRVYLSVSNCTTPLEVKASFKPISSVSYRISGMIAYTGSSALAEVLKDISVRAFDGLSFYDVNFSADDNEFSKKLPEGVYDIIAYSKSEGYKIVGEKVELTNDVDITLSVNDKNYGATRDIVMDNVIVLSGGYKEVNLPGKVTSDRFVHTFWLGLSDDANSITEQQFYVNNWYLYTSTNLSLRLQLIKWNDGYSVKFVDLSSGPDLSASLRQMVIENNGLYFGIVRDGGVIKLYAENADGNMEYILERTLKSAGISENAQFTRVALECAEGCDSLHPSMARDIVFVQGTTSFDNLPAVNVKTEYNSSMVNVSAPASANRGENITITVTPQEGYVVDTVTFNGTVIKPVGNSYTVKAGFRNEIKITAYKEGEANAN